MKTLEQYAWPGNVRELANLIERLIVIKPNGIVKAHDLPWPIVARKEPVPLATEVLSSDLSPVSAWGNVTLPCGGLDLKKYLAKIEQDMIHQALVEADGVVQRAAELLGVGRTTLVEKIRRYELNTSQKSDE
jgi:sigma-54 specific flagellar transcriptional regulator A